MLSPASLGIVVFRFVGGRSLRSSGPSGEGGKSERELDELSVEISRRLLEENVAGAMTTKLGGKTVLRICAISPELSLDGMSEVVAKMGCPHVRLHRVQ